MSATANATSNDSAREIGATRVLDAPRDLVFQMWTDPQHIGNWWGPRGFTITTHSMDVRPGGSWEFIMHGPDGRDYKNHIVYREIVKPERLAYSHVSGPLFDATATFTEESGKTRITMRMVFESAELRNRVAEEFGAVEGLQQTLERLGEEVESMRDAFVFSRTFDAPRDLMFDVWTDEKHLSRWFGPKGVDIFSAKNDLRPGGTFLYGMRAPDGTEIWGKWIYREIVKPERLVFVVSFSDANGGVTRHPFNAEWPLQTFSVVTFTEEGDRTTVTVQWTALQASDSERKAFADGRASMQQGWGGTFEDLRDYIASIQKG